MVAESPLNELETDPAGVYVAAPVVVLTVAVLFSVVSVLVETLPLGVKLPVEVSEEPLSNREYAALKEQAEREHAQILPVCAQLEAEIAELDGEEKQMFLEDLGIAESGLDRLIKASYSLLGLISYLTAGPTEVRAWTIVKGTKAPGAAGKIHSDFERGFIRAEVVSFEDLERLGSMNAVREAGLYRSEGKEYVMKDGDIVLFRFNV